MRNTGSFKTSYKKKNVIPGRSVENIILTEESEYPDNTNECDNESNTEKNLDNNLNILEETGPSNVKKADRKFNVVNQPIDFFCVCYVCDPICF